MNKLIERNIDNFGQKRIFKEFFEKYLAQIASSMSTRDKMLLSVIGAGLVLLGIFLVISKTVEAFDNQQAQIKKLYTEVDTTLIALQRYQTLKHRRQKIEKAYKEIQVDANESYFENLLKAKAGIVDAKITPLRPKPFGDGYNQSMFNLEFNIVDSRRLEDFLKELVTGNKPVLISELTISSAVNKSSLLVSMSVTSLKKNKS